MSGADTRFSLSGKRAIVYGAACGIGRAVVHEFLGAGAVVLAVDMDAVGLEETAAMAQASDRLKTTVADVTQDADVADLTNRFCGDDQPCDVLVYSVATRYKGETVVDMTPDTWRKQIDVNLTGAFVAVHNTIPAMTRGGSIILVASQLGSVGVAGAPAYCASKGALIQLAKALAIDHADQNIRANTLSPGAVGTERLAARFGSVEEANKALGPRHVTGRIGVADEMVGAARFLASDASAFMTGADLLVDGGYNSH